MAAVVTVVAVTTLIPSGHQAQLAAWTVAKQADGKIYVTIRELRDPAGLQRTLRADGAPTLVLRGTGLKGPCLADYYASSNFDAIVQLRPVNQRDVIIINPSAIPRGLTVMICDGFNPVHANSKLGLSVALLQSTKICIDRPLVTPASSR